jgi:membrane protease YdiL (CAAX protease family)
MTVRQSNVIGRAVKWLLVAVSLAVALHLMARALVVVVEFMSSGEAVRALYHGKHSWSWTSEALTYALWGVVIAPMVEELVFRKWIFNGVRRYASLRIAVFLPSMLFAAMHIRSNDMLHLTIVASLLVSGIVYQLLYLASGSLWVPMAAHAMGNAIALAPQPLWGPTLNSIGLTGMESKVGLMAVAAVVLGGTLTLCCRRLARVTVRRSTP